MSGPKKATAYVREIVVPVRRATSPGPASNGGKAMPSVKTRAELPPSSAAQNNCRGGGVKIQPVIATKQKTPAATKGQRCPASRCAKNVTPRLLGNCDTFSMVSAAGVR